MKNILIVLGLAILAMACKPEPKTKPSPAPAAKQELASPKADLDRENTVWKNTQLEETTNGKAALRLPKSWKRSTLANASTPPKFSVDRKALDLVKKALSQMNYSPDDLDVWTMPDQDYRQLYMLNTDTISLSKGSVGRLSRSVQASYKEIDESMPDMDIKLVDTNFKEDKDHKVVLYKYSFDDKKSDRKAYLTTFFITTQFRSFIVYEISDNDKDTALYWWSIRKP